MRFGVMGLATFFLIFFLIIINSSEVPSEKIDSIFEGIDQNNFVDQNFSSDTNLSKFIKYTGQGIIKEVHGGYYLASWLNTVLPIWVIENKEILTVLAILALCAPIIGVILNYVILIALAILIVVWDKVKEIRKANTEKRLEDTHNH